MKIKDLETDNKNLFDEIEFFKTLDNRKSYFNEFIFLYGERDLLSKVVDLYNKQGLQGIGSLFVLKTDKWNDYKLILSKVKEIESSDKTVTITGSKIGQGGKIRKSNTKNNSSVVPFDISDSINNEQNSNNLDETETNNDSQTVENKTVYNGYDKDKIDHFLSRFKNYTEYRKFIYSDIVNMLALQIY